MCVKEQWELLFKFFFINSDSLIYSLILNISLTGLTQ